MKTKNEKNKVEEEQITISDVKFPTSIKEQKIVITYNENEKYDFWINEYEILIGVDTYNSRIVFNDVPLVQLLNWVVNFSNYGFIVSTDIKGNPFLIYKE